MHHMASTRSISIVGADMPPPKTARQRRAAKKRLKNTLCSKLYSHFWDPKTAKRSFVNQFDIPKINSFVDSEHIQATTGP